MKQVVKIEECPNWATFEKGEEVQIGYWDDGHSIFPERIPVMIEGDCDVLGYLPKDVSAAIIKSDADAVLGVVVADRENEGDDFIVEIEYDENAGKKKAEAKRIEEEEIKRNKEGKASKREAAGIVIHNEGKYLVKVPRSTRQMTIPKSVIWIGSEAFIESEIETIVIPGNVKEIGDRAFEDCNELKDVVIEEGVEKIGRCAFWRCRSLKSILIPASVKRIEPMAFEICGELEMVRMPSELEYKGFSLFSGCDKLDVLLSPNGKCCWKVLKIRGDVVIPEGVEEIADDAFANYAKLDRLILPKTLKNANGLNVRVKEILVRSHIDLSGCNFYTDPIPANEQEAERLKKTR